jgi:glycosyltransferase involved in cell wall biosynthesis
MKISVIVTTYNRPKALEQVLKGLFQQTRLPGEIVVADDGSTRSTNDLVTTLQEKSPCPLAHSWQPDEGFRAAAARNRAAALTTGDYILFLDDDCIPLPHHIQRHELLARPGWFVAGNRILLARKLTREIEHNEVAITHWSIPQWLLARLRGQVNRLAPLIDRHHEGAWREHHPGKWEGVKTCNLGVWRNDFLLVNGFDEDYQGWGHEDADLAVRLIKAGITRRDGRFAVPVLHLWHPVHDRTLETDNRKRLQARIDSPLQIIRPDRGIAQYLH